MACLLYWPKETVQADMTKSMTAESLGEQVALNTSPSVALG